MIKNKRDREILKLIHKLSAMRDYQWLHYDMYELENGKVIGISYYRMRQQEHFRGRK